MGTGGFWRYVERGDLLLISATLGVTALGELVGLTEVDSRAALASGGAIAVNAFAAAILYPYISVAAEDPTKFRNLDSTLVVIISIVSIIVTAVAGSRCISVSLNNSNE